MDSPQCVPEGQRCPPLQPGRRGGTIQDRLIPRFGNIDATDGGVAHRYSGSVECQQARGKRLAGTALVVPSDLDLFSNFTHFLDDVAHGDASSNRSIGGRLPADV